MEGFLRLTGLNFGQTKIKYFFYLANKASPTHMFNEKITNLIHFYFNIFEATNEIVDDIIISLIRTAHKKGTWVKCREKCTF